MRYVISKTIVCLSLMILLTVSIAPIILLCEPTNGLSQIENSEITNSNIASEQLGFLKFSFMTKEGNAYPVNLTLSNGVWRKEFHDVTQVMTNVPAGRITYTYVYNWVNHPSLMQQGELTISAGEIREFIGYVPDPTQFVPCSEAFIVFEEVGANAYVTSTWNSNSSTLTMSGYIEAGKSAAVAVVIDNNTTKVPNYVLKTCQKKQHPWICVILGWEWHFDLGFSGVSISFSEISSDKVIVGFRRALYNDAIIDTAVNTFNSLLWDSAGRKIDMEFVFPQYAVTPGYYTLQPLDVPTEFAKLKLPLRVSLGKPIVLDYLPPKIVELQPFTFSVVAEYFFGKSSYSNLIHDAKNRKITTDIRTNTMYDWWGYFVLPKNRGVKKITMYSPTESSTLLENYDYIVNRIGDYNVVVVRIDSMAEQLALDYTTTVGGVSIPIDKLGLLMPYIGLPLVILVATVVATVYVKHTKYEKQNNKHSLF